MNITISSRFTEDYLLIESKGKLETSEELLKHSQLLYEEIVKNGAKKILINEPGTHFPLDLFHYFDLVQNYVESFPPEIRTLKIAIVIADEYKEVAASWEALCVSRGLSFFAFTSFEDARECLRTG